MERSFSQRWARMAVPSGLLAVILYPLLLLAPLPLAVTALCGCLFGLALGAASAGLYHVLALHRRTVSAQAGAACNIIAGAVFSLMVVAQLSVNSTLRTRLSEAKGEDKQEMLRLVWQSIDQVQLGFDVVWDFFLIAGTILLALNMARHPRFGLHFAMTGIGVALALLVLNFYTFPVPPGQGGLIDLGPAAGLWYLAVTVQVIRSLRWIDQADHPGVT